MVLHLTKEDFKKEVLESEVPVLVDFSAVWCGPCKMMGPVMDQLAEEYNQKIKVAKVDIDEAQELAMEYKIMSVPTMLFFKSGRVMEQVVGAVPKTYLAEKIDDLV